MRSYQRNGHVLVCLRRNLQRVQCRGVKRDMSVLVDPRYQRNDSLFIKLDKEGITGLGDPVHADVVVIPFS
jgi:hypothetical protein